MSVHCPASAATWQSPGAHWLTSCIAAELQKRTLSNKRVIEGRARVLGGRWAPVSMPVINTIWRFQPERLPRRETTHGDGTTTERTPTPPGEFAWVGRQLSTGGG
jgi:hypothetical protein